MVTLTNVPTVVVINRTITTTLPTAGMIWASQVYKGKTSNGISPSIALSNASSPFCVPSYLIVVSNVHEANNECTDAGS